MQLGVDEFSIGWIYVRIEKIVKYFQYSIPFCKWCAIMPLSLIRIVSD